MARVSAEMMSQALPATRRLRQRCDVVRSCLFGSYVWGEPDEYSDVDVAAFVSDLESWDLKREVQTVVKVESETGHRIELHLFPASVLPNPEPASLSALILRDGVLIEETPES